MRFWPRRFRFSPPPEVIVPHPGVPNLADWDRRGIVGTIGSGSAAGTTVVARPYWTNAGRFDGYELEFCDGAIPIRDASGCFVMDQLVFDDRVPGEEGGLIDALTREVEVHWWTDRNRVSSFWAEHDDRR